MIVDLDIVNVLLCSTGRKKRDEDFKLVTGNRNYGLAMKLALLCEKCNKVREEWSSEGYRRKKDATPSR